LGDYPDLVDVQCFHFRRTIGILEGDFVISGKQLAQPLIVFAIIPHRQPGYHIVRNKRGRQVPQCGHCQHPGKFVDQLLLVQRKLFHVGLLFGKIADEIRLAVHCHMKVLMVFAFSDIHSELNIRRLSENRFENMNVPAVGRLGETETDINSRNIHRILL